MQTTMDVLRLISLVICLCISVRCEDTPVCECKKNDAHYGSRTCKDHGGNAGYGWCFLGGNDPSNCQGAIPFNGKFYVKEPSPICDKAKDAVEVKKATSSSVYNNKPELWGPQLAWKGQSKGNTGYFHSKYEAYPWLRIEFTKEERLSSVTIINRINCCGARLRNVQIRAGLRTYKWGQQVGVFKGPGVSGGVYEVPFKGVVTARFISFQIIGKGSLQINGLRFKRAPPVKATTTPVTLEKKTKNHDEETKTAKAPTPQGTTCKCGSSTYQGNVVDKCGDPNGWFGYDWCYLEGGLNIAPACKDKATLSSTGDKYWSKKPCETETTETAKPNKIKGGWSEWSEGKCSAYCGGGMLMKIRSCSIPKPANGGEQCVGAERQLVNCMMTECENG